MPAAAQGDPSLAHSELDLTSRTNAIDEFGHFSGTPTRLEPGPRFLPTGRRAIVSKWGVVGVPFELKANAGDSDVAAYLSGGGACWTRFEFEFGNFGPRFREVDS
ncbi:hypothetical protein C8Q73DRAFT_837358 [Cubamyces lactineus]|nr:hypothetical protein C8Q73DRAFT_837358 [Cubamyces lactineus]